MKKSDFAEIKNLDILVIKQRVMSAKQELADLILDKNMKKLKDTSVIGKKRRDIAQMLTVLRQKELLKQAEQALTSAHGGKEKKLA